jgi:hypothetical protein
MGKPKKGWFEIFRGGKQRDSNGTEVDGDALIDKILSKFASGGTDAGLVVGHPDDDAPVFGKIAKLNEYMRDGTRVLIAKPHEVVGSFSKQIKKNWFPGRSIGVESDGTLLHVGFLPKGVPPAVKGMLPAEFQQAGGQVFFNEFESQEDDFFSKFKSWLNSEISASGDGSSEGEPTKPKEGDMSKFSQEDLDAATKKSADEASKKAKEEARKEFAEKQEKQAKKTSDKEVKDWVYRKVKSGVILPALVDGGLVEFMQCLDIKGKHEFSEGEERTPLEFAKEMLEFLGGKGKIETGEFAKNDDAPPEGGKMDPQVEASAALAFQAAEAKKGNHIGIAQAVTAIRSANKKGGAE